MDRRLLIKSSSTDVIRDTVTSMLTSSITQVRGDYPAAIVKMLETVSFDNTVIPEDINLPDLLSSTDINDLLDYVYIDFLIQYYKSFEIEDAIQSINSLFDETIIPISIKAGNLSSRLRAMEQLSEGIYSFTDVIHESFNTSSNYSQSTRKLVISPGAGILKLPYKNQEYARPELVNISLRVLSKNGSIIDSSDSNNVFNNLHAEPYYINIITNGTPENPIFTQMDFSLYRGILAELVIQFPSVVPVDHISFTQFSTAPIEILGVFTSQKVNSTWANDIFDGAITGTINYDNPEIELNFPREYVREIHIVIHQMDYLTSKSETQITTCKTTKEYLNHCTESFRNILPEGITVPENLSNQFVEIIKDVQASTTFPINTIAPNMRSYAVGVYNLSVSDTSYSSYGEYESKPWNIRGSLASISIDYNGNPYRNDSCCTLFVTQIGDRSLYLAETSDETSAVVDASVIVPNRTYSQGVWSVDPDYPYQFETHFIPLENDQHQLVSGTVFYDGSEHLLTSGYVSSHKDYSTIVKISTSLAHQLNFHEGSILTLKYMVPTTDRYGNIYRTNSADLFKRFGKPNIIDNVVMEIEDQYLMVPDTGNNLYVSYNPTEYYQVLNNESPCFCLGSGKNESPDADGMFLISGELYISGSFCSSPYDGFYYGVVKEQDSSPTVGPSVTTFNTSGAYVKGSLKVYRNGYIVDSVTQYDDDSASSVLTMEQKSEFTVPNDQYENGDAITFSYIPVDYLNFSGIITTNIANHNFSERFTGTVDRKLTLSRYPFVDHDIVNSKQFYLRNGVFVYIPKFSITYEPVVVYVNGIKAYNITDYRGDKEIPDFGKIRRTTEYKYYVDGENNLVFDRDVSGNIMVYYYVLSDALQFRIEMYRSNYYQDDITPELFDFTALVNLQR